MNKSIHYVKYQSSPLSFHLKNTKYIQNYFWYFEENNHPSPTKYKNEFSYQSIFIFNPNILGKINLYCQTTYKNGKNITYSFPIHVLPNLTLYYNKSLTPFIIQNKEKIIVYKYDKVSLKVEGASTYLWRPILPTDDKLSSKEDNILISESYNELSKKTESLPSSCYPTFYSQNVEFIPKRDLSYEVIGYDDSGNSSSSIFIDIILQDKPMEILDIELIPNIMKEEVLHKKKNKIIHILKKNPTLLNQLTQFYNITLMSAHNTEFQSKNGRGYRVPWFTFYQKKEDSSSPMLLSFQQQYQFLRYLLNNTNPYGKSYFMYLINIIQYNFVLPSPSAFGFNIRREKYGP
jgi:hypothetical protein